MTYYCQMCKKSSFKKMYLDFQKHKKLFQIAKNPESKLSNAMKRKNACCRNCGLFQATKPFTEQEGELLYKNFDDFDIGEEFQSQYLSKDIDESLTSNWFKKRIDFYQKYFLNKPPKNVGMLRYFNGSLLKMFNDEFGSNLYGYEFIKSCKNTAKDRMKVNDIELEYCSYIKSLKIPQQLDVLIVFHFLTHSINIKNDILKMKSMVSNGGIIIFMDEIQQKPKNPAHMVHFTEETLTKFLISNFGNLVRIDGVGGNAKHICDFTLKSDNPDFIVTV